MGPLTGTRETAAIPPPALARAPIEPHLDARRARAAAAWNLRDEIVLVAGRAGVVSAPARPAELRELIHHARRVKDEVELERMRRAAAASVKGYATLVKQIRPGITERALQIEMEAEFFRAGGDRTA